MVKIYDFNENNYHQLLFYPLPFMPTPFQFHKKNNYKIKKKVETLDLEIDLSMHETRV
jgi:hypothetical protein